MASTTSTRVIEFVIFPFKGQRAYVTYDDGEYMRVTPVHGDPLASIQVKVGDGSYRDAPDLNADVGGD